MKELFLVILGILAIIDFRSYRIPNVIVLPCTLAACFLLNTWLWAMMLFAMSTLLYRKEMWAGGDVKLMAFIGSVFGGWAILILISTLLVIKIHRSINSYRGGLAVAPFIFAMSYMFYVATQATSLIH